MTTKRSYDGFTLIELIISIGLLALISTIALYAVNIKRNREYAFDAVRKSDINAAHTSLTAHLIQTQCLPTQEEWNALRCNDPVPASLSEYFSSVPCDPETNELYYYEPLTPSCELCTGGCGECTGFRILTRLKRQNTTMQTPAGCSETLGCGVLDSSGAAYNYGAALTGSCTIAVPTGPVTPSFTPTPPIISPSATPTLSPTPTPLSNTGKQCVGQLLINGSFEIDTDTNKLPDNWSITGTRRPSEGTVCNVASEGICRFVSEPWIPEVGWSITKALFGSQTRTISGNAGDTISLSADVRSTARTLHGPTIGTIELFLRITYADATTQHTNLILDTHDELNPLVPANTWYNETVSLIAAKPYTQLFIAFSPGGPDDRIYSLDNICVTKK